MKKTFFMLGLLSFLLPVQGISQECPRSLKRKVAIGRFSNETQYAKSIFYDKENDPMGKQASDILAAKLAATEKFLLIERQDYDRIAEELRTAGTVSQNIGADYLIVGSITEYGRKTVGRQRRFSNSKQQIVEAGVSIRLVDVSIGLIVFSGEAKGEAVTENKRVIGLGGQADYDATLSDKAISAAIGKLTEQILFTCMDNPWKAYLLSEQEGIYFVFGGKSQGILPGDEYVVMEKGARVKNPQTGMMIELPGKEAARIRIDQTLGSTVTDEISIATLISREVDDSRLEHYFITDIQ
ncbi:MAG: CsgG/HfaB family protein [Rikenellaceae bacterium]|nr:CsgG/HfaB family protein [Rikenellaceae bacterium]